MFEGYSPFEILLIISIVIFCVLLCFNITVVLITETIENIRKLFGYSLEEKVTERLDNIEHKVSVMEIDVECNGDDFEILREYVDEIEERLKKLENKGKRG